MVPFLIKEAIKCILFLTIVSFRTLSVKIWTAIYFCKVVCICLVDRFDIFSFLVQFVHRDGMIGEQARGSLLLCMSISKNNNKIAEYVISQSNICPVKN